MKKLDITTYHYKMMRIAQNLVLFTKVTVIFKDRSKVKKSTAARDKALLQTALCHYIVNRVNLNLVIFYI
jgi:hypothetical protein